MLECGTCLFNSTCRISEQIDDEDLCDSFIDIDDFYLDECSEVWFEFSYNQYTEGCLDTVFGEYELFEW
jgi:hypothetical protein